MTSQERLVFFASSPFAFGIGVRERGVRDEACQ